MPDIVIYDLNFSYNNSKVLNSINLEIDANDFVGIIGPNGGGKTTLIKIILGLLKPQSGSVSVLGRTPSINQPFIGYVPQFLDFNTEFPIKVIDVVLMGLFNKFSFFPVAKKDHKRIALEHLSKLGIERYADSYFSDLSGGQKQRVLIARAIINSPKILILDEPTSSVDSAIEKDIFELLKELNTQMTILLISHDIGFISNYVKRIVCLNRNISFHKIEEVSGTHTIEDYAHNFSAINHKCGL